MLNDFNFFLFLQLQHIHISMNTRKVEKYTVYDKKAKVQ